MTPAGRTRDAGAATVWAAGMLVLVLTATVLAVAGATATGARHSAQLAADLAALAAAGRIGVDPGTACPAAARVAGANAASVVTCSVTLTGARSGEVRVEVERRASWAGLDLSARARARAGRLPGGSTPRPVAWGRPLPGLPSMRARSPCGSMIGARGQVPTIGPAERTVCCTPSRRPIC